MQGLRGIRPDRRLVGVEEHVTGCDAGDLAVPGEHVDLALPKDLARLQPGGIDVDVGQGLVVGKSTVPVGTADRLTRLLQATAPCGDEAELAWNPEFLREGFAVEDTMRPDRLVFGVASDWARTQLE